MWDDTGDQSCSLVPKETSILPQGQPGPPYEELADKLSPPPLYVSNIGLNYVNYYGHQSWKEGESHLTDHQ